MLTSFYLWMIYTASYWPCYLVCLIDVIIQANDHYKNAVVDEWKWNSFLKSLSISTISEFVILSVLLVLSVVVVKSINHIKTNTRIKLTDVKEVTYEMLGNVATNVISALSVLFSYYGILIAAIIFISCGVYYVISRNVHYTSLFTIPLGYRVFKSGEGKNEQILLARGSRDAVRLATEEHVDGLEARELERRVYLIPKL